MGGGRVYDINSILAEMRRMGKTKGHEDSTTASTYFNQPSIGRQFAPLKPNMKQKSSQIISSRSLRKKRQSESLKSLKQL